MRHVTAAVLFGWLSFGANLRPAFPATIIEYEVEDLMDTVAGEDRWAYRYFVSGFAFEANQGFTIWFDRNRYGQLEPPSAPNSDWDVLVLQPDLALPADGAFDALALVDMPSLSQPFLVSFVSLAGRPGSQPFDINEFDSGGNLLRIIESGVTIPRRQQPSPIPEPRTAWTTAGAGALLLILRRVLSRQKSSLLAAKE